MKIYELRKRTDLKGQNPWEPWYDKAFGFIILAKSEDEARKIASENCGDEGPDAWLSNNYSSCNVLDSHGSSRLILRDFASA